MKRGAAQRADGPMSTDNLKRMLDPEKVVLVGATDREGSLGRAILANLLRSGAQTVLCVNPNKQATLGVPCSPSVSALPGHIDLAVIAVPAPLAPGVVEECGRAGVSGAVIITDGRAEKSDAGRQARQESHGGRGPLRHTGHRSGLVRHHPAGDRPQRQLPPGGPRQRQHSIRRAERPGSATRCWSGASRET